MRKKSRGSRASPPDVTRSLLFLKENSGSQFYGFAGELRKLLKQPRQNDFDPHIIVRHIGTPRSRSPSNRSSFTSHTA